MNIKGMAEYFINGKSVSTGTPNESTREKLPQLNTASIVMGDFNSNVTYNAWTTQAGAILPFSLTDLNPDGVPYVTNKQSVSANGCMTLLTFTKLPFLVAGTSGKAIGGLKLLTMPFGRYAINGGVCIFTTVNWATNYQFVQTTGVAGTVIGATGSGDFSVGTTKSTYAASGNALATPSTGADIVASTAFIDPFVAGVGSNIATPGNVVNSPTEFDGSTTTTSGTAKSVNLNVLIDSGDTVDTNAGLIFLTGFLRFYSTWLGDW